VVAAARPDVPAVDHELLGAEPAFARGRVEPLGLPESSGQLAEGLMFTSMTPGSGVILMLSRAGSFGGR
jgi:hypothetical protein